MPHRSTLQTDINIDGTPFRLVATVETDNVVKTSVSVAGAKAGSLTTRTNATSGTLTMDSGHGIATSAVIDLYWTGGSRRGVTVGTVATNSVPISSGSGDDLPPASTAITAAARHTEAFSVVGDNCLSLGVTGQQRGTVVFADGSNVEQFAVVTGGSNQSTIQSYAWNSATGLANPLASKTVAKVFITHGSVSAANFAVAAGYN